MTDTKSIAWLGLDASSKNYVIAHLADDGTSPLSPAKSMRKNTRCPPPSPRTKKPQHNEPRFEARAELYRLCGVELTQLPRVQINTALVPFTEPGPDLSHASTFSGIG